MNMIAAVGMDKRHSLSYSFTHSISHQKSILGQGLFDDPEREKTVYELRKERARRKAHVFVLQPIRKLQGKNEIKWEGY